MKFNYRSSGKTLYFDIAKIADAIRKTSEATRDLDQKIEKLRESIYDFLGTYDCEELLSEYERELRILQERKRWMSLFHKALLISLNRIIRIRWLERNSGAGRGNTSSVSDKMLLTIPTPPTAVAAACSLLQRGMACEMLG